MRVARQMQFLSEENNIVTIKSSFIAPIFYGNSKISHPELYNVNTYINIYLIRHFYYELDKNH